MARTKAIAHACCDRSAVHTSMRPDVFIMGELFHGSSPDFGCSKVQSTSRQGDLDCHRDPGSGLRTPEGYVVFWPEAHG
jgi:hypothetical protein